AWALSRVMSPRAAYLHVGAAIGTIMAANVLMVIIPSQQAMVAALARGQPPDAQRGKQAALRSLHNNYLTLPVLFIMVSNHYPATYGSWLNWAILAGLSVVGALTRHWFNLRNQGRRAVWILPAAALGMVGLAFVRPVAWASVSVIAPQFSPRRKKFSSPCPVAASSKTSPTRVA